MPQTATALPGAYDAQPGQQARRLPTRRLPGGPQGSVAQRSSLEKDLEGQQREEEDSAVGSASEADQNEQIERWDIQIGQCTGEQNGSNPISALSSETGQESQRASNAGHERLVEAHKVEDVVEVVNAKPIPWWTPRKAYFLVVLLLLVAAIIIGTAITVITVANRDSDSSTPNAPELPPDVRLEKINETIREAYDKFNQDGTWMELALQDPLSLQSLALQWLALHDALQVPVHDTDHILQRYALFMLYYATGGETWTDQFEFLGPNHECSWSGALQCDGQTVTGISLDENEVTNSLPRELALLTSLRSLSARGNYLTGTLPPALPLLTRLDLGSNELTGTLHTEYGTMSDLESLRVGENSLTGTIFLDIGGLTKLTSLSLEGNRLSGKIPESIWNLEHLVSFTIGQQELVGEISPLVGRWKNCTVFHVNKLNGITGSIPSTIGLLTHMKSLKFSQNHMRGTLPTELGNLQNLTLLALSRNGYSGTLPTEFAKLTNLEQLYIQNTWLEGNMEHFCDARAKGEIPHLTVFNADLEEVNCTCCTCCSY